MPDTGTPTLETSFQVFLVDSVENGTLPCRGPAGWGGVGPPLVRQPSTICQPVILNSGSRFFQSRAHESVSLPKRCQPFCPKYVRLAGRDRPTSGERKGRSSSACEPKVTLAVRRVLPTMLGWWKCHTIV